MMNLAKFSNEKFESAKAFTPVFPDGSTTDAKIYIKSMKSKEVLKEVDKITKRTNQATAKGIENVLNADIDLACTLIEAIEGFTISKEDNTFGFETEKDNIVSTKANIKILVENFHFIRQQVAGQANDDSFFYTS